MPYRVLLCDDEIHILRAVEIKLARAGHEVECAADGEEAWECILANPPDLLVTDYQMPRLDGFELVERVRAHEPTRDMPVLMLTARGFEQIHRDLAVEHGILAILAKPFSPRELLQRVNEVLESGASSDSLTTS